LASMSYIFFGYRDDKFIADIHYLESKQQRLEI